MTNKFLTCFEREDEYNNSLCNKCNEAITNPLCHNCLGNGIAKWLSFYPKIKKKVLPKLKSYIIEVNNSAITAVNCVACKKRKAALCPYCFTEGVLNLLKINKIDNQVIGDFLTIFNFDLKHEGYLKDAIQEGIY